MYLCSETCPSAVNNSSAHLDYRALMCCTHFNSCSHEKYCGFFLSKIKISQWIYLPKSNLSRITDRGKTRVEIFLTPLKHIISYIFNHLKILFSYQCGKINILSKRVFNEEKKGRVAHLIRPLREGNV